MRTGLPRYAARARTPLIVAGTALIVAKSVGLGTTWTWLTGVVLLVAGIATTVVRLGPDPRPATHVHPPVRGRWVPVNSPADKVPSHGTHEAGQTYAIDLVYHPDTDTEWTGIRTGAVARRPETFPGFGRPVYAVADGVVVRATGRQRDHRSRNSAPGVAYLFLESMVRQLASMLTLTTARFLLGNHIIVDIGDGAYAVYAHLRRGSPRVRAGERVRAGQPLAECGNSGNTSEPHLHFHLMDRARPGRALGLPFTFDHIGDDGPTTGVPGGTRPFVVPDDDAPPARTEPAPREREDA